MSGMTIFFLFVSILALVFLIVNLILALHDPYPEKYSIFECGFHSFLGQNRIQFGVKFFSFALVYLLLDLEILLSFPFGTSEYANSIYGLVIALLFIFIITIGFFFELGKSALKIDSRQVITSLNVKSSNVTELIGNYLAFRPLIIEEGALDVRAENEYKKGMKNGNYLNSYFDHSPLCGGMLFKIRSYSLRFKGGIK